MMLVSSRKTKHCDRWNIAVGTGCTCKHATVGCRITKGAEDGALDKLMRSALYMSANLQLRGARVAILSRRRISKDAQQCSIQVRQAVALCSFVRPYDERDPTATIYEQVLFIPMQIYKW